MSIQTLYANLLQVLRAGNRGAVISEYRSDGSVSKELVSSELQQPWARVRELERDASAVRCGPVTSIAAADGSLTLIEYYTAQPRLIILGGGHVALALAQMARLLDFEIVVYDDRPAFANSERFSMADTVICDGFGRLFERVDIKSSDFVVVVTRGHKHDYDCLSGILAGTEPAYTGMIGSKRRVAIVRGQLRDAGYDQQRLAAIYSPIGLKIGAVTPAEIAVSIIAQIIEVKRVGTEGRDLRSCDLEVVEVLGGGDFGGGAGNGGGAGFEDAASSAGSDATQADALITIYHTSGSVPIETGAKLCMTYSGTTHGTIGGGCSEAEAMQVARSVINTGGWKTHMIDMTDSAEDDGMVCGGEMHVVIEPVLPRS